MRESVRNLRPGDLRPDWRKLPALAFLAATACVLSKSGAERMVQSTASEAPQQLAEQVADAAARARLPPACTSIITFPCVIRRNGSYRLASDIRGDDLPPHPISGAQQAAIEISKGVTLARIDCDHHAISNHDGYGNRGVGIYGGVSNVEIFDCNFFGDGLAWGVYVDNEATPDHKGIVVRDSRISATLLGVQTRSAETTVSNNIFQNIGGQAIFIDGFPGAINLTPPQDGRVAITNNIMRRFFNPLNTEVFGIACRNCRGVIEGNVIENDTMLPNSWAIWLNPGTYTVRGNTVRNFDFGFGLPGGSGSISGMDYENVNVEVQKGYDDQAWSIH